MKIKIVFLLTILGLCYNTSVFGQANSGARAKGKQVETYDIQKIRSRTSDANFDLCVNDGGTERCVMRVKGDESLVAIGNPATATTAETPLHVVGAGFSPQLTLQRTSSNTGKWSLGVSSDAFSLRDEVAGSVRFGVSSGGATTLGPTTGIPNNTSHSFYGTPNNGFPSIDLLGVAYRVGADANSSTRTDATNKLMRFYTPHYLNAEENVFMLGGINNSTQNILQIGGTSSAFNSLTDINIYTAANNTTVTGTLVGSISSGTWTIGPSGGGVTHTINGAVSLAQGQIDFPASQNASAGANTLDDYEEGTWTPSFSGASVTNQLATARYTKVGNLVCFTGYINTDSVTGSGDAKIAGLPFTPASTGAAAISALQSWAGTCGGTCKVPTSARINGGITSLSLFYKDSLNTSEVILDRTNVDSGTGKNNIAFSGCYSI